MTVVAAMIALAVDKPEPTKCKWVLRKKAESDGSLRLKIHIVILGYMHIPGVDYTESFSPVANDVTIRIAMAITLSKKEG